MITKIMGFLDANKTNILRVVGLAVVTVVGVGILRIATGQAEDKTVGNLEVVEVQDSVVSENITE